MFYCVYIFFDNTQERFYVGFTANIERRIKEHNRGQNWTTKRMLNRKIVFTECFTSEEDARRREKYFKTTKGRKTLKIMLRGSLKE